jgi:rubrerythrin
MVIMLELGTFGAVMKFAIQIEEDSKTFYEAALGVIQNDEINATLKSLVQRIDKRLEILERVRRENVTEMILEPIKDLESNDYLIISEMEKESNSMKILEIAVYNEGKRQSFFQIAAEKIEFLIEAATVFERFADENSNNMNHMKVSL